MQPIRPKKHLGQHFLTDESIARKIANSVSVETGNLLEIGPGTGVLTKYLIEKQFQLFKAIEIDRESIEYLSARFQLGENLISGDFLRIDIAGLFAGSFSIIGNFPYNISSQIFFKILENRNLVTECVCMLQQEVARRIASPPGNKDYGILSVLLQAWYNIEYLFSVSEQVFSPPPKVQSAVIRLRRNTAESINCDEKLFFAVVKTGFNQRRKTLHNALKPLAGYQGEFAGKRAEQLGVQEFVRLTNEISQLIVSQ
jgi:16S rRNA (adenine1518-N6/adenine1519-N6)-dimethyltransferase